MNRTRLGKYRFERKGLCAIIVGVAGGPPGIHTATKSRTGLAGCGSWRVAGNWDFGVPGTGDDVVIPAAAIATGRRDSCRVGLLPPRVSAFAQRTLTDD